MKISVITASYNCGQYLQSCIKSVQKQKFEDYEHLILNDKSTDGTKKMLRRMAAKDKRIRILKTSKRLKCGSAYAKLASEASGEIVGVLDSDDALTSKSIETIVRAYDDNPQLDYIWTQFWLCDKDLRKLKKGFSRHPGARSLLESGVAGKHNFSHWRTFKRKILEKGPIFPIGLPSAVDKFMGYSMEELGPGGFLNVPLYYYRQRVGGLSFTGRKHWKRMKKSFTRKRLENGIQPFSVITLK